MKTATKLYPFSGTKHAHDIDFRRNRVHNEIAQAIADTRIENGRVICPVDRKTFEAMEELAARLDDLILYMHEGVVWLDGKRWALANECVNWAAMTRTRY